MAFTMSLETGKTVLLKNKNRETNHPWSLLFLSMLIFLAVLETPELVRLGNKTPKHNQLRFRFPPKKIITRQVGKKILKRKIFTLTLVVVAQLVERSLPTPRSVVQIAIKDKFD